MRLGKPGVFDLNEAGRAPQPEDTHRACALGARVAWSAAALASGVLLVAGALGALPTIDGAIGY